MASFNNQNSGLQFMTAMASNFNVAGDLPIEDVHNPSNDAVQNDFNADTSATLHPVCPDPDVGYQPLSDYLVAKLLRRTMQYFKNFCAARQVELDTKYWKRYTRRILETQSPDKALVISSPAGSGKSTWMQSFLLALRDVMKEQPEFDLSLVGVVVVLQKVEDLNELADLLNQDCAEDHPVMVSLQGWTDSGSRRGLCRNPSVDNYEASSSAMSLRWEVSYSTLLGGCQDSSNCGDDTRAVLPAAGAGPGLGALSSMSGWTRTPAPVHPIRRKIPNGLCHCG